MPPKNSHSRRRNDQYKQPECCKQLQRQKSPFHSFFRVHRVAHSWCEIRSIIPMWRCQGRHRLAARHRHGGVSLWRRWSLVARHGALGRRSRRPPLEGQPPFPNGKEAGAETCTVSGTEKRFSLANGQGSARGAHRVSKSPSPGPGTHFQNDELTPISPINPRTLHQHHRRPMHGQFSPPTHTPTPIHHALRHNAQCSDLGAHRCERGQLQS